MILASWLVRGPISIWTVDGPSRERICPAGNKKRPEETRNRSHACLFGPDGTCRPRKRFARLGLMGKVRFMPIATEISVALVHARATLYAGAKGRSVLRRLNMGCGRICRGGRFAAPNKRCYAHDRARSFDDPLPPSGRAAGYPGRGGRPAKRSRHRYCSSLVSPMVPAPRGAEGGASKARSGRLRGAMLAFHPDPKSSNNINAVLLGRPRRQIRFAAETAP